MSKQTEIIRELQDRVNATEAICIDLLSRLYNSETQGRTKFNDYRTNYTQEAIEHREAEAKATQLRDNYNTAKADFRELANTNFWTLVFLNEAERHEKLDDIWSTITDGLLLPEDAARPQHTLPELTVDMLISRRAELRDSISSANASQCDNTIEHCNKSKIDFTKSMEKARDKRVAELSRNEKLSESDRQTQISDTQAHFKREIQKHLLEMNRRISSEKVTLKRLEDHKTELAKVEQSLVKLLTK